MNTKFCTCSFYKCRDYGFNPVNHHPDCPMYKQKSNIPYIEEWNNPEDKIKFEKYYTKKRLSKIRKDASIGGKIAAGYDKSHS